MPKLNDPPRVAVAANRPQQAPDWSATSRDIAAQTDWHVRRIEQRGRELRVTLDDAEAIYWRERADRAAAVLNRDAPANVDRFALTYRQRGVDVAEHVIDRDAWVAQQTQPLPPHEQRAALIARAPEKLASGNALPGHAADVRIRLGAELSADARRPGWVCAVPGRGGGESQAAASRRHLAAGHSATRPDRQLQQVHRPPVQATCRGCAPICANM